MKNFLLLEVNFKKLLLLLIILLTVINAYSAEDKAYAFYPFGAYSDETSAFVGAYAIYTYKPENLPENYQPASFELNLILSFKKQISTLIRNRIYLANGKYSIGIPLRYYRWPTTFYGIGNQSEPDTKENFTREYYEFNPYIDYHLNKITTVSTIINYEQSKIIDSEIDNPLLNQEIPGYQKYLITGIGFGIERETTDNSYFPTTGSKLSFQINIYNHFLGSDYDFRKSTFDYRRYRSISKSQTLAGQFLLKSVKGDIPFQKYPDMGNDMRGFEDHKYINDHFFLLRMEDRIFPWDENILQRLGFVAFMETGQTMPSFSEIMFKNQKISAGFGFRFILLPEQMLTLRADFAFSKNGFEMEIISFEAF
ncbi:MAG: BamA/TamA family outer membrane protein [Candidatus Stygibacter frigidus]|nr:BamA/TamA family outer membrane protein [Candidatus Stygibacter frigidus]